MAHNFTNVIMLVVILKNLEDWGQISNKNQELLSHKSNMKVERKESIGLAKKFFQSFLYQLKGKTKEFNTKTKWSKIWETGTPNMKKKAHDATKFQIWDIMNSTWRIWFQETLINNEIN